MVPPTILRQLDRLRWRERLLRFTWGAALGLTVAAAVMAVCCLADWIIDRRQETPYELRRGMLLGQVILWAAAAGAVVIWALIRRVSDTDLALYVEDKVASLGHRLISALQLNQPNANTQGMSPALIAAVTSEAEREAVKIKFAGLADHRRVERSAQLGFGVGVVLALLLIFAFDTTKALLARQFLANVAIPRSVTLASDTVKVWPSGEEVTLRFKVHDRDRLSPALQGEVRIDPDGGAPSEFYPLVFESQQSAQDGVFVTKIKSSTLSYHYRAWLRDGRTHEDAYLQLEPRPSIVKQQAWVRLPSYVGKRPDGQYYEINHPRGDVVGLAGATARVTIQTQKPVTRATIELLGRPAPELLTTLPGPLMDAPGAPLSSLYAWIIPLAALSTDSTPTGEEEAGAPRTPRPELRADLVLRRVEMKLDGTGQNAEGLFDLRPGESVYRIQVQDQYGFTNLDPPRRSIRLETEEPPVVALLPERFPKRGMPNEDDAALSEDDDVEGVPILYRSMFRVAYTASTPYGLGRAVFRYRINEGEWQSLPLKTVAATQQTGPFDLRRGSFVNSGFRDEIEFHKVPSPNPLRFPSGTEGGGRFDFKTAALDTLQIGDKIEFYLEVYDRNPAEGRQPGRSETRQKTVVNAEQFVAWGKQVLQEESRIRQLESKQRSVFTASTTDDTPTTRPLTPRDPKPKPRPAVNVTQSPFVRNWQIIGPFANTDDGQGFDTAYPPEKEPLDLGAGYDGIKGKVHWKLHRSPENKIDLEKFLKHSDAGVAYAVCWFRCIEPRIQVLTGSDDGIKVWIDRHEVLSKKARREAVAGEDKVVVKLNDEDWHELLVKVDNRTASWAFFLELRHPATGRALDSVKFRTTPPGDEDKIFVREWQLIGPFANVGDDGRNKAFGPEMEPVDLEKEYDGIPGKVKWKLHKSDTGRIGLDHFFERPFNESNLAYAVCWVKTDREREAVLATGSDDGIKVWLNRKLKINVAGQREAEPGKDLQKVTLPKGWSELLVKVDNHFGRWAFFLELRDLETERPLDGVEYRTTPPKEGE